MRRELAYAGAVGVVGFAAAASSAARVHADDLAMVALFCAAFACSALLPVVARSGAERISMHGDEAFVVAAIIVLPPPAVVVAVSVGTLLGRMLDSTRLSSLRVSRNPFKVAFHVGKATISAYLAVAVAGLIVGSEPAPEMLLVAAGVGGVVYAVSDFLSMSGLQRLLSVKTGRASLINNCGVALVFIGCGVFLAAGLLTALPVWLWILLALGILLPVSRTLLNASARQAALETVLQVVDATRQTDPGRVRELLTEGAKAVTYAEEASIGSLPPSNGECGVELVIEGAPRWLVVAERRGSLGEFSEADRKLLEPLAVIGQTALANAHLHEQTTATAERCELTGLLNRSGARRRFEQWTERRSGNLVAVLFMDLDGFKAVNDTHGHETGDRLLIEVAGRLKGCVRSRDLVARWSGDEFVVLVPEAGEKAEVRRLAERIDSRLRDPFAATPAGNVSASIGVAFGTVPGDPLADLVDQADRAMYAVKATRSGRSAADRSS